MFSPWAISRIIKTQVVNIQNFFLRIKKSDFNEKNENILIFFFPKIGNKIDFFLKPFIL